MLRAIQRFTASAAPKISRITSFTGRLVARVLILPVYRLATMLRLRYARVALPARSIVMILVTNRYLFHGIIILITAATVGFNFVGRQAKAQDIGQTSILYDMVAGDNTRTMEEDVRPELLVQDSSYAKETSLIAVPDIDFNYDDAAPLPLTAPSVPGTLVANLVPHQADQPEGPGVQRTETETYTVKEGDTLSVIAQRFGVNIGTILWANDRSATQYIRPGDTLRIPPVSGVLVTVKSGDTVSKLATTYGSDADEIIAMNRLDPDKPLQTGLELVLPGGQPPYTPPATTRTPSQPSGTTFVQKPPDAPAGALGGKLLWPTSGRTITQYYGWRHTGLDIDGDYSSPLYASHDGAVTVAGWNKGGYGLQVVVNGSGVMTRYAHASKVFVTVGQQVKKGQVIAMMGTTGRSTGTHLHYEVYINGRRVNPLTYIR